MNSKADISTQTWVSVKFQIRNLLMCECLVLFWLQTFEECVITDVVMVTLPNDRKKKDKKDCSKDDVDTFIRRKWKEKKHSCLLRAENVSDESEKSEVSMCLSEDGNSWKNRKSFQYHLPLSPRGGRGAMILSNIYHICTHFYALVKIPCHLPPLYLFVTPSPT